MVLTSAALVFLASLPAWAARQCFSAFNGDLRFEFNSPVTSTTPLTGRAYGPDAECDGLTAVPLSGSSYVAGKLVVVEFRMFTVDTDGGCSAADFLMTLSGKPLSGSLVLSPSEYFAPGSVSVAACPSRLPGGSQEEEAVHANTDDLGDPSSTE